MRPRAVPACNCHPTNILPNIDTMQYVSVHYHHTAKHVTLTAVHLTAASWMTRASSADNEYECVFIY
jgi:hypothetical protein